MNNSTLAHTKTSQSYYRDALISRPEGPRTLLTLPFLVVRLHLSVLVLNALVEDDPKAAC
jgi:hypothetical protein